MMVGYRGREVVLADAGYDVWGECLTLPLRGVPPGKFAAPLCFDAPALKGVSRGPSDVIGRRAWFLFFGCGAGGRLQVLWVFAAAAVGFLPALAGLLFFAPACLVLFAPAPLLAPPFFFGAAAFLKSTGFAGGDVDTS
jgi:hypothetical protein